MNPSLPLMDALLGRFRLLLPPEMCHDQANFAVAAGVAIALLKKREPFWLTRLRFVLAIECCCCVFLR